MSVPKHGLVVISAGALLVAVVAAGCTLAGASAAPLTPVVPGAGVEPAEAGESGGEGETIPTPTEIAPVDVFGTQTAMAPPPEETPAEETPEPGDEMPPSEETAEATEAATPEAEETPEPQETQPAVAGACPPTHTVQSGENLFRIALRYGLTYQELAAANGIANPNVVAAGAVLKIPGCGGTAGGTGTGAGERQHVVQSGENLFRIALRYGLTYQELARYNGISDPNSIVAGQVIRIPAD